MNSISSCSVTCNLIFKIFLLLLQVNIRIKKSNIILFCIEYVSSLQLETITEKKKNCERDSLGANVCPDVNRNFMKGINACRLLPYIIFTALKTLITAAEVLVRLRESYEHAKISQFLCGFFNTSNLEVIISCCFSTSE